MRLTVHAQTQNTGYLIQKHRFAHSRHRIKHDNWHTGRTDLLDQGCSEKSCVLIQDHPPALSYCGFVSSRFVSQSTARSSFSAGVQALS